MPGGSLGWALRGRGKVRKGDGLTARSFSKPHKYPKTTQLETGRGRGEPVLMCPLWVTNGILCGWLLLSGLSWSYSHPPSQGFSHSNLPIPYATLGPLHKHLLLLTVTCLILPSSFISNLAHISQCSSLCGNGGHRAHLMEPYLGFRF